MKREKKIIPDNKYRVIKIGKEAIFEFLYESFKDRIEMFFDVSDMTTVVTAFDIDWEKGEFICVARNEMSENEHLQIDVDLKKLLSELESTTDTLFQNNRYVELSKSDIEKLTNC
ncbi:MAG: hypothetical protein J6R20_01585 [Clostridia bacterium]|nr:hypothetical protein [Clostridia bacterium]